MEKVSLYEYLGKPAGPNLGKEVAEEAKKQKINFEFKEIESKNYKGKVMMYPTDFLDSYFRPVRETAPPNAPHKEEDDLPF